MSKTPWIALFAASLFMPLASVGCTVDESFPSQPGTFFCEEDSDCESPFICEPNTKTGEQPSTVTDDCIDEDMDGYGVGEDNSKCDNPTSVKDPDDSNAQIFPGAQDICDGIDNDADPATADGDIDCTPATKNTDCPQGLAGTQTACQDNKCVYVSAFGGRPECKDYVATCMNGQILPEPPEACK